jgi:site-specific recombinase XerC
MNDLTVVKNGVDGFNSQVNNGIKNGIRIVKKELRRNSELREKLVEKVVEKKIVDEVEFNYDISGIKVNKELKDFLKIQTSETTKINYKKWITDFLDWCRSERIRTLKITRREVESYMVYLCDKYSSNSVRSRLMGVCSFYQFLIYRYHKIITVNPFHKLKLPKIRLVRRVDIITETDLKELKKELNRIRRDDILCVVDLIVKYGFRVGIFENMKIDREGNWRSVSKESEMKGKFLKSEVKRIKENDVLKLRKYTISNIIIKYTTNLYKDGKVGSPFSVHDIRHYFITKNGKDLTMEQFIKFSRKLHKNINTTISYMNV